MCISVSIFFLRKKNIQISDDSMHAWHCLIDNNDMTFHS